METKGSDTHIEIMELHPHEMELLHKLRTQWRFGEVTIVMRDGVPVRLRRVVEFADLSTGLSTGAS